MSFQNKINGCLLGYAIGDALGRGTEYMTEREAARRYPEGLHEYSDIIRDAHRSRWQRGDVTHTTQVVLQLAESMIECGEVDYKDYARRLKGWFLEQDIADFDAHLRHVFMHPSFARDPHAASRTVYQMQGLYEAPNEALGRSMIIGLWPRDYERLAIDNCKVTHWDSRCHACCAIIATMANELLWHRREADYDRLVGIADRLDPSVLPYLRAAREGTLEDLHLDDEETYWYVRKNLGAALWSLWHAKGPEEGLDAIISKGGDADANGALAMGLLGLKYGANHLPPHLIETLHDHRHIQDIALRLGETLLKADDPRDTDEQD